MAGAVRIVIDVGEHGKRKYSHCDAKNVQHQRCDPGAMNTCDTMLQRRKRLPGNVLVNTLVS